MYVDMCIVLIILTNNIKKYFFLILSIMQAKQIKCITILVLILFFDR